MSILSRTLLPAVLGVVWLHAPAEAALPLGAAAPTFTTQAALGGKPFTFNLSEALKKGPVVVYFYPKAFTSGCTVEAHLFAEATPEFNKLGATVIGVSNDTIETLKKFSVEECRNQFAVGADDGRIIKLYDAGFMMAPSVADRISYVIAPDGKVIEAYSSMDPEGHVTRTMAAVKKWKASAGR
jgi:thioredoxin-dependent peroxiredoxin